MTDSPQELSRASKKGMDPGSLVYIGEKKDGLVNIRLITYSPTEIAEDRPTDISRYQAPFSGVTWVDIDGIHDPALIEALGKKFDIHVLVLEDVMNSESRPKVEFYDEYMFITLKMLELEEKTKALNVEQLSLVVSKDYVLMFQQRTGDNFDPIRDRLRRSKGKIRNKDGYYLAFHILDNVVDNYIAVSEKLLEQIETLENNVIRKPSEFTLHRIMALRKELLDFKKSIDPLKEAINTVTRELDEDIAKYYRDLYDHIIYESENLAMYREMLVNLQDLYHSNLGMKMNQVIKVLTIITTIFVPLTFIVGVYGMNFDNMPELRTRNGYYYVLGGMFVLVMLMLLYFRRKRWL